MKFKKIIVFVVCFILSLAIGFGFGYLFAKKDGLKLNNTNMSFSTKDFTFSIDEVKVLKLNYDYTKDSQYNYLQNNYNKDALENYIKHYDNNFNIIIKYTFENKSKNSVIPNKIIQLKLFADGLILKDKADYTALSLYPEIEELMNNSKTELQAGKSITAVYYINFDNYNELTENSLELNLYQFKPTNGEVVLEKETDLIKTFSFDLSQIDYKEDTYSKEDNGTYIIKE